MSAQTKGMVDAALKALRAEMELRRELHRNDIADLRLELRQARDRARAWAIIAFASGVIVGMFTVAILVINSGGAK